MSTGGSVHKVVIIGGGFGGLLTAQGLNKRPVDVTMIDRRNSTSSNRCCIRSRPGGCRPRILRPRSAVFLRKQRNAASSSVKSRADTLRSRFN
ncbi:MAG: FAD-dependent oxidoreductase [Gemmataceae bacterium]